MYPLDYIKSSMGHKVEYPLLDYKSVNLLQTSANTNDNKFLKSRRFRKFFEAAMSNLDTCRVGEGVKGDKIYIIPHGIGMVLNGDREFRNRYLRDFGTLLPKKVGGLFLFENKMQYLYYTWDRSCLQNLEQGVDLKLACASFIGSKFCGYEEVVWRGKIYENRYSFLSTDANLKNGAIVEDVAVLIGYTEKCKVVPGYHIDSRFGSDIYIVSEKIQ